MKCTYCKKTTASISFTGLCPPCQKKMDDAVAFGSAIIARVDFELYHRGFVRSGPAIWHRGAIKAAPGAGKRFGNPNSTELHRTPQPLLPAGGAKVGE